MIKAAAEMLLAMDDESFSHVSDGRLHTIAAAVFWAMIETNLPSFPGHSSPPLGNGHTICTQVL